MELGPRSFRARAALLAAALGSGLLPVLAAPEPETDYPWGEFEVGFRYRVEHVSDDDPQFVDDALASTLRTTALYRSPSWRGFSALFQFEDVSDLGAGDRHNNAGLDGSGNGVTDRPVIADPDLSSLLQALVRYRGVPRLEIAVGRMEIALGTERFVGPSGWRQHHQTFSAARIAHEATDWLAWSYTYVDRVHRLFGDSQGMSSHLLDVPLQIREAGTLTAYLYHLDYDDAADAALSSRTYGARWESAPVLGGDWSLPYRVEAARQHDAADNPAPLEAAYHALEVGAAREHLWFRAGVEILGGSLDEGPFSTPLATLHKWQGWADKFLSTPPEGVEDLYAGVGGEVGGVELSGFYHRFAAESGGADYGDEIDAQALYTAPWGQTFGLQLAAYDADEFAFDTFKAMLWTVYSFPR